MDPDVVEIPPPLHQNPPKRVKKEKQSVYHNVIDLEADEDLVVLGATSRKRSKGKAVETIHGGDGDHKLDIGKSGTVSGIKSSNGKPSLSRNVITIDGQGSKPFTLKPEYDLGSRDSKSPHLGQFGSAKQGVASSNSFPSNLYGHNGSLKFANSWLNNNYNFGSAPQHSRGKPNVLNSARVGQNGAYVVPPGLTTISHQNDYFETDYENDYENDYEDDYEDDYYGNDYKDDYYGNDYGTYSAPPAYYPTTSRVPIKSEPSIKSEPFIKSE